jgi:DNA-binding MarR family transcriptional regulator
MVPNSNDTSGARTVATAGSRTATDVDEQFMQLASWIPQTLRALQAAASPPPIVLRTAKERGSLSKRHLPALLTVTFAGPLTVSELAARLGIGLSTTSTLVGELSRTGLLMRSEDEADHRRRIVRLNDEHRDAITGWALDALAPLRRTLERLTPEAREAFVDGWRILREEAGATSDPKAPAR